MTVRCARSVFDRPIATFPSPVASGTPAFGLGHRPAKNVLSPQRSRIKGWYRSSEPRDTFACGLQRPTLTLLTQKDRQLFGRQISPFFFFLPNADPLRRPAHPWPVKPFGLHSLTGCTAFGAFGPRVPHHLTLTFEIILLVPDPFKVPDTSLLSLFAHLALPFAQNTTIRT